MNDLDYILESLLFVAEEPLTVERLKNILETVEPKEIRAALFALAEQYESRGGGFGLYEVAGGWQLRSRPQYSEWIKRMLQPPAQRLTKATLETLAIVAYNQPIIRADIEHIRGVDCGGVLRQLLERKLVRVLGRKEIPGRPLIYATTKLFLELFDLKDLKDLPSPKEIETLTAALEDETAGTVDTEDDGQIQDTFEAMPLANRPGTSRPEAVYAAATAHIDGEKMPGHGSVSAALCYFPAKSKPKPHIGSAPAPIADGQTKIKADPARISTKPVEIIVPAPSLFTERKSILGKAGQPGWPLPKQQK